MPADRFANAVELDDALGAVIFPPVPVVDQSRLDTYQVSTLPFFLWPQGGDVAQNERCVAYPSGSDDDRMFVKVWTAIRRGQSAAVDIAMLAMFDAVSRLRLKPAAGLPHYVDAGLSQAGTFIVRSEEHTSERQ